VRLPDWQGAVRAVVARLTDHQMER
jgi:hypothetical protein